MKKPFVSILAVSALLNLSVLPALAADENAETDKGHSKMKPHSHPVDKGTAPVPKEHQGPHDKAKKDDADKDKSDKHSHPRDAK